jgi:hypothetical protein
MLTRPNPRTIDEFVNRFQERTSFLGGLATPLVEHLKQPIEPSKRLCSSRRGRRKGPGQARGDSRPRVSESWTKYITIERGKVSGPYGDCEGERITIEDGLCLQVSFVDHQPDSIENNSDRYTIKLTTPGGQPFLVNGRETDTVEFTIVGNCELGDFLSAISDIGRLRSLPRKRRP